jgi:hypothetical protein
MSIYANGLNIQMNEVAVLTFMEQSQQGNMPVCQVAIQYEILKMMHETIGRVIAQHDAKLSELQRTKGGMN